MVLSIDVVRVEQRSNKVSVKRRVFEIEPLRKVTIASTRLSIIVHILLKSYFTHNLFALNQWNMYQWFRISVYCAMLSRIFVNISYILLCIANMGQWLTMTPLPVLEKASASFGRLRLPAAWIASPNVMMLHKTIVDWTCRCCEKNENADPTFGGDLFWYSFCIYCTTCHRLKVTLFDLHSTLTAPLVSAKSYNMLTRRHWAFQCYMVWMCVMK